jgi:hypothetical protein
VSNALLSAIASALAQPRTITRTEAVAEEATNEILAAFARFERGAATCGHDRETTRYYLEGEGEEA